MWTVYELTLNLYQGFLYTWFITKILSRKNDEWWPFTACALLTALGFSTYLVWPMPFEWDTWVFVFIAAYSIIFLKGTLLRKVFWVLMLIIMTSGTIGIIYQIFNLILGADIDYLLQESGTRIVFTIIVNFCLWLVLFLITRLFQSQSENERLVFHAAHYRIHLPEPQARNINTKRDQAAWLTGKRISGIILPA